MVVALLPLLLPASSANECAQATGPEDIAAADDALHEAFTALDDRGMASAAELASEALRCYGSMLSCPEAATYFRVRAISDWVVGRTGTGRGAARAARMIDPEVEIVDNPLPPVHPLVEVYQSAPYASTEINKTFALKAPPQGSAVVDCVVTLDAPASRPWILQELDPEGVVVQTMVMEGGERPSWLQLPPPVPVAPPRQRGLRNAALATGGAALLTGATTYGLYRVYTKTPPGPADLDGVWHANRALLPSAVTLGVGSVGLTVAAAVQGQW